MSKSRILFLLGGRSGEHEVSLISGKNILAALDRDRFEPLIIVIHKNSEMHFVQEESITRLGSKPNQIEAPKGSLASFYPYPIEGKYFFEADGKKYEYQKAFPVLHGPGGEDGSVQGLFELGQIPLVGCNVKSSAVCSDKAFTKRLLREAGIPTVPFVEVNQGDAIPNLDWDYPVFVKPNAMGSSVGVYKVDQESDLKKAVSAAFQFDHKILIEKAIEGRELEIAVFGEAGSLIISPMGEIVMASGFYSYEAKYIDDHAAKLVLPAELSEEQLKQAQKMAADVFLSLGCRGMARIDFFLTKTGEFVINEPNTIPGFTSISMYPKLMELAGVPYQDLISKLIDLA